MSGPLGSGVCRLGAGASLPDWVPRLDRTAFGVAWKAPAEHEALWLIPEVAFARWARIPAAGEAELLELLLLPHAEATEPNAATAPTAAAPLSTSRRVTRFWFTTS